MNPNPVMSVPVSMSGLTHRVAPVAGGQKRDAVDMTGAARRDGRGRGEENDQIEAQGGREEGQEYSV